MRVIYTACCSLPSWTHLEPTWSTKEKRQREKKNVRNTKIKRTRNLDRFRDEHSLIALLAKSLFHTQNRNTWEDCTENLKYDILHQQTKLLQHKHIRTCSIFDLFPLHTPLWTVLCCSKFIRLVCSVLFISHTHTHIRYSYHSAAEQCNNSVSVSQLICSAVFCSRFGWCWFPLNCCVRNFMFFVMCDGTNSDLC